MLKKFFATVLTVSMLTTTLCVPNTAVASGTGGFSDSFEGMKVGETMPSGWSEFGGTDLSSGSSYGVVKDLDGSKIMEIQHTATADNSVIGLIYPVKIGGTENLSLTFDVKFNAVDNTKPVQFKLGNLRFDMQNGSMYFCNTSSSSMQGVIGERVDGVEAETWYTVTIVYSNELGRAAATVKNRATGKILGSTNITDFTGNLTVSQGCNYSFGTVTQAPGMTYRIDNISLGEQLPGSPNKINEDFDKYGTGSEYLPAEWIQFSSEPTVEGLTYGLYKADDSVAVMVDHSSAETGKAMGVSSPNVALADRMVFKFDVKFASTTANADPIQFRLGTLRLDMKNGTFAFQGQSNSALKGTTGNPVSGIVADTWYTVKIVYDKAQREATAEIRNSGASDLIGTTSISDLESTLSGTECRVSAVTTCPSVKFYVDNVTVEEYTEAEAYESYEENFESELDAGNALPKGWGPFVGTNIAGGSTYGLTEMDRTTKDASTVLSIAHADNTTDLVGVKSLSINGGNNILMSFETKFGATDGLVQFKLGNLRLDMNNGKFQFKNNSGGALKGTVGEAIEGIKANEWYVVKIVYVKEFNKATVTVKERSNGLEVGNTFIEIDPTANNNMTINSGGTGFVFSTVTQSALMNYYIDNVNITTDYDEVSHNFVSLEIDTDVGDYEFFDSNEHYVSKNEYANVNFYPKTNSIVCGRFDYQNPNRSNDIVMEKLTNDDCFFDVALEKNAFTHSTKRYRYYLIEGKYLATNMTGSIMYMIRDNSTSSTNQQSYIASYESNGSLVLADNSIISNVGGNGTWFNLKMIVDTEQHTYDVYVDNVKKASAVAIPETINDVNLVRYGFKSGNGSGTFAARDMRVVGMERPFKNDSEVYTSVFHDETAIREFLSGTQAFHSYGQIMYFDGKKKAIDSLREGSEMFVGAEVLNQAFSLSLSGTSSSVSGGGITVDADGTVTVDGSEIHLNTLPKSQNGKLYIPLTEFCKKVLSKNVFYFETGMYIVSDTPIMLNTDGWIDFSRREVTRMMKTTAVDELNSFLQFERPTHASVKANFQATAPGHPRIYASAEDFENIRSRYLDDASLNYVVTYVLDLADSKLNEETITYGFQDTFRQNLIAESFLDRMLLLGYAWQITGDVKYFEAAWNDINSVSSYPDYNPGHIIDAGIWNTGLAIAYDWFYDAYTPEQREVVKNAILKKGLKELRDAYYGRVSSVSPGSLGFRHVKDMTNYNAIANCGAITAALAIMDESSSFCFDVIKQAGRSIEYSLLGFSPAGGWSESPSYWNMTIENVMIAAMSLKNTLGTDYGLTKAKGVNQTLQYMISLNGPRGINNFHDSPENGYYVTYDTYIPLSKLFNDPSGMSVRKNALDKKLNKPTVNDALFYDPDASTNFVMDKLIVTEGVETFTLSSNNGKYGGNVFLSGHFGNTGGYHSQNDTGTFVLDLLGERWAIDLGMEDYNLTNVQGVPLENTYRRRAEGHNVPVINPGLGYNQRSDMYIPIEQKQFNNVGGFVTADLTGLYADTSAMKTGFYVGNNYKSVTIRHEIDLKKQSDIYWFMHTRADIEIDGNTAYLSQKGKRIKVTVTTNSGTPVLSQMDAVPLPTSPNPPGQNANEGIRKLAVNLNTDGHLDLVIKITPDGEDIGDCPESDMPISQWVLP